MKKVVLIVLAALLGGGALFVSQISLDAKLVTPVGEGTVVLDAGSFEAFPLPNYAAKSVTADYKSYFVEVEPGIKVHVLEVGTGYPVFLQHGNPTSGFLYRKVAAELPLDQVRLIMPTLVGLGFSSKIPVAEHTLDNHMQWINEVLTQLKLEGVVYVGQDWGGPVGMGALALSPGMLEGAVIMNTAFNAPKEKMDISRVHAIVKTPIVGELATEVLISLFDRLPGAQGDPASMPPEVIELYKRPVHDSGNIKAPLTMMRMVSDGPDHPSSERMRFIEAYVGTLDIPAEIVWGMRDPVLGKALSFMQQNFPDARVTETEAGHFLQEEVPVEIAAAILRVLDKVAPSEEIMEE